jgi:hypothetical protein
MGVVEGGRQSGLRVLGRWKRDVVRDIPWEYHVADGDMVRRVRAKQCGLVLGSR